MSDCHLELSIHAGEFQIDIVGRVMASFTLMKTNDRDKGGTRSSGSESCKSPTRPMARVYADNACIGRTPLRSAQ